MRLAGQRARCRTGTGKVDILHADLDNKDHCFKYHVSDNDKPEHFVEGMVWISGGEFRMGADNRQLLRMIILNILFAWTDFE